jgi:hypothetical protein
VDNGGKVGRAELVDREGKPQVCLGERGDITSEGICHGEGHGLVSGNRDEGAFVEVDDEASGRREIVKHLFKVGNMFRDGTDDDEGVISILEDRTGEVVNKRV